MDKSDLKEGLSAGFRKDAQELMDTHGVVMPRTAKDLTELVNTAAQLYMQAYVWLERNKGHKFNVNKDKSNEFAVVVRKTLEAWEREMKYRQTRY